MRSLQRCSKTYALLGLTIARDGGGPKPPFWDSSNAPRLGVRCHGITCFISISYNAFNIQYIRVTMPRCGRDAAPLSSPHAKPCYDFGAVEFPRIVHYIAPRIRNPQTEPRGNTGRHVGAREDSPQGARSCCACTRRK